MSVIMNVPTMNKQIIFVDSSVQDYQSLIQGIDPAQIVILNENSSAIDQITNALASQQDIEAVHILSHGSEGSLKLGADVLNGNDLEKFSTQIKQWGNALTENADILLYGCDVAAVATGLQFIQNLHQLTGADIAASNNKTGNQALGGDWELEVKQGNIETQPLNVPNYSYTLAPTVVGDKKALLVNSAPTATKIDVLANDTGTGRLKIQSIATAPTNGTAIINDAIYVGGYFTTIGQVVRNRIARFNSDGTLDSNFNPDADGFVYAIALDSSGNPIVGGNFTNIGGQPRNYIAKLNPTTGAADTTFNSNADSFVTAIATDSSGNPIVGGYFTNIGAQPRNKIAKLNPTTGVADTTFNPNADSFFYAIATDSSGNPIVGGNFTNIDAQPRNYIAKLNPTTGAADTTFNPNADSFVSAIATDSSGNPIVGGNFTNIGAQPRNYIAKLNPTTGAADTTFNPNADNDVLAIATDSSGNPIVGGHFTNIGGQPRNKIAKLNPTTGAADATFNQNADEAVTAIAIDPGREILYTPN